MKRATELQIADLLQSIADLIRSDDQFVEDPQVEYRAPDQFGLLSSIATINITEDRGLDQKEASDLCVQWGYDPRGFGSVANRGFIDKKELHSDGLRWVSEVGLKWLADQGWQSPRH